MGHTIQAFIAKTEVLRDATRGLGAARVIPIGQGLALLPNTDELLEEAGAGGVGGEPAFEEFYGLGPGLAELGAGWSAGGAVAYVETDYFGGEGKQAAVLWERGPIAYGPARGTLGPINDVLRRLGVERGGHTDEFDAAGLGRHRNNRDWIERS
jgi:hypothetical protein